MSLVIPVLLMRLGSSCQDPRLKQALIMPQETEWEGSTIDAEWCLQVSSSYVIHVCQAYGSFQN